MRLWVLFLLTETTHSEKANDCVIVSRVSLIKLSFLDNFWLDFLHQFWNRIFLQIQLLVADFGLRSLQREHRGRNCRECFFSSSFFELVSWNYQLYFTNQAVNWLFLIESLTKMTFGLVPSIESLNNRSFLRVHVVMFSLKSHLTPCKICLSFSDHGVNRQVFTCNKLFLEQIIS